MNIFFASRAKMVLKTLCNNKVVYIAIYNYKYSFNCKIILVSRIRISLIENRQGIYQPSSFLHRFCRLDAIANPEDLEIALHVARVR